MGGKNSGFASLTPEKQREIASKGGRAAHQKGTAYEWTSFQAREAGRKGSQTRAHDRRLIAEADAMPQPEVVFGQEPDMAWGDPATDPERR